MESIRPAMGLQRQRWFFAGLAVLGAVLTALALAAHDHGSGLGYGVITLAFGLFGTAYLVLVSRNSWLLAGPDCFGYRDALGRTHLWHASQIGTIVDVTIVFNKSTQPRRAIYFLGLDGRRLVVINPGRFTDRDIARVIASAHKPVDVRTGLLPVSEFKRDFPNAIGWIGTHSMLAGAILAVGLGVLVFTIIAATSRL